METLPERVGRYEILSIIGRGAMGVVYRARDPLIGREVALKRVSLSDLLPEDQRAEFNERFFREARAAGNLRHPNVVTIYDVGESDSVPYMAMEYLTGGSLSALMKAGPLPLKRAASIARQVALGLHYAHGRGIVHRDVKPDNIILDADGRPVVTDFGAAHLQSSELTRTGEVLGTPHYMSPEQILGEEIDGRSDLFSLGVVFYLMVTGKRPFKGDTISAICYHIVHSAPEPLPDGIRVPPTAVPVLQKLLAKARDGRFPDGAAVAEALEALEAEPGDAPAAGSMTQTVCVPTPTPKPGTLPVPAPAPPPPRPVSPARPVGPPRPPTPKSGTKWVLGLLIAFIFLVFLILAILGGAWVARRIEMRNAPATPVPQTSPEPGTPTAEPSPTPIPISTAPNPQPAPSATAVPPAPTPRSPVTVPKPAVVAPRGDAGGRPPAAIVPTVPNPAVLSSCDTLGRDAVRAEELARSRDFSGACALADRFPQRLQEIAQSVGPAEQTALAAARTRVEQAGTAIREALAGWAKPIVAQAQATYTEATDGMDDEDGIIRSYVQIAPALPWRDRLPPPLRAEIDTFVGRIREDLDEDEWATAQRQAHSGGSR